MNELDHTKIIAIKGDLMRQVATYVVNLPKYGELSNNAQLQCQGEAAELGDSILKQVNAFLEKYE